MPLPQSGFIAAFFRFCYPSLSASLCFHFHNEIGRHHRACTFISKQYNNNKMKSDENSPPHGAWRPIQRHWLCSRFIQPCQSMLHTTEHDLEDGAQIKGVSQSPLMLLCCAPSFISFNPISHNVVCFSDSFCAALLHELWTHCREGSIKKSPRTNKKAQKTSSAEQHKNSSAAQCSDALRT